MLRLLAPNPIVGPALPLSTTLTYANLPKFEMLAKTMQLCLGLGLCYVLALGGGIVGLAAGVAVAEVLAMGWLLPSIACRKLAMDYPRYLLGCLIVFALTSASCGAAAWALVRLTGTEQVGFLLLAGGAWGLFAVTVTFAAALPASQRSDLLTAFSTRARALFT
jgi:hypothetical protein